MDLYVYDSTGRPRHALVDLGEHKRYLLVEIGSEGHIPDAISFVRGYTRRGQGVKVFLRSRRALGVADALLRHLESHGRRCEVMECSNVLLRDTLRLSHLSRGCEEVRWDRGLAVSKSQREGVMMIQAKERVKKAQTVCVVTSSHDLMRQLCSSLDISSSPLRSVVVVCPTEGSHKRPSMCDLVDVATAEVNPHMTVTLCESKYNAFYTENDHHAGKVKRVVTGLGVKFVRYPDWFETMTSMKSGHLADLVRCVRSRRTWLHLDVLPEALPVALIALQKLVYLELLDHN